VSLRATNFFPLCRSDWEEMHASKGPSSPSSDSLDAQDQEHAAGWVKPNQSSDRETRVKWIEAKYKWKGFTVVDAEGAAEGEGPSARLYEAAGAGDLKGCLRAVAHGADVNWVNGRAADTNPMHGGYTALHKACAEGKLLCAEVLFQNGADLDALDQQKLSPTDVAMLNGHLQLLDLLELRAKAS
jgi:hypothetical protein